MTVAEGTSIIRETILKIDSCTWRNWAAWAPILRGWTCRPHQRRAPFVRRAGQPPTRASACLVLADAAHGNTEIQRIYHLDRG